MEIWSKIEGASDRYAISDHGRVWSANIGIMKTPLTKKGYPHLSLRINGKTSRVLVHRLVGVAFLLNKDDLPQINHMSGNKQDNRASKLELCSAQHNVSHSFKTLGRVTSSQPKRKKPVLAKNIETGECLLFNGVRECARELKMPYQAIQRIIKKQRKTYGGWTFTKPEVFSQEIKPKI